MSKMEIKGLGCVLHMPKALKSKKNLRGEEQGHGLPPYNPQTAYVVDEYPAADPGWMHGSAKAASYFVGVKEGHGLWLDLNSCRSHSHEVAAVISVQGINPITGQPQQGFGLEQYREKCPVHNVEFKQDRFCEKCKHKWPAQNYMATTGTPHGLFWLDGFRDENGTVRQYIFTKEKMRGIAEQILGENRSFAIGIAFYLSRKPKPEPKSNPLGFLRGGDFAFNGDPTGSSGYSVPIGYSGSSGAGSHPIWVGGGARSMGFNGFVNMAATPTINQADSIMHCQVDATAYSRDNASIAHVVARRGGTPHLCDGLDREMIIAESLETHEGQRLLEEQTRLEIGAGAKINQQIYDDPQELKFWKKVPHGMIYINYVTEEQRDDLIQSGSREEVAGFLSMLKIGN